jgi:hypothetical protein
MAAFGQIQSSKWKFEFTGLNQILEFIFIYLEITTEKLYWSRAGGPVLIVRTGRCPELFLSPLH